MKTVAAAVLVIALVASAGVGLYVYSSFQLGVSRSSVSRSSCAPGESFVNGTCFSTCTNGATNPPTCSKYSGCTNGATNPPACNNSTIPLTCTDPNSISSHVYNPARLTIVKSCITASGIVDKVIQEMDGDLHLRLRLDPADSSLTNSANDQYQYGDLVVEIICVNPATQADAEPSCQNYANQIAIPQEGQHITVTGPYVLDTEHYNWAEIHPVYSLKIDTSTGTTVHITSETLNIMYPGGSAYGWLGPSPRSHVAYVTVNGGEQFTDTLSLYSTSSNSEKITSITTTTPGFSIISISPNTSITFGSGETVSITLTIQSPNSNYDGSLDLQIATA